MLHRTAGDCHAAELRPAPILFDRMRVRMGVSMTMRQRHMRVRMRMHLQEFPVGGRNQAKSSARSIKDLPCRSESEQDQNHRDRDLHRESKPQRHLKLENMDRGTDQQDGERMAETPYKADPGRGAEPPFTS